jgi:hypothetical protein
MVRLTMITQISEAWVVSNTQWMGTSVLFSTTKAITYAIRRPRAINVR